VRIKRLVSAAGLGACAALCHASPAGGQAFPSMIERIAGARVDVAPPRAPLGSQRAALRIEFGDLELFGIAGLRASGVRASAAPGGALIAASLSQVSSPVGTHARAVAEAGYARRAAWQGAVRWGFERLAIEGAEADRRWVTGAISRVDIGPVAAVADLERVSGEHAYATSLVLAMRVSAGAAQLVGSMRVDGDRFVGAGVAVALRLHSTLGLMAGYDDGSQTARAGAVIAWRGLEIATGVFQHPVLGTSQGVTIACTR
jgi:hypothetical protein